MRARFGRLLRTSRSCRIIYEDVNLVGLFGTNFLPNKSPRLGSRKNKRNVFLDLVYLNSGSSHPISSIFALIQSLIRVNLN